MNRLPPQQHMYAYQQSTHTPPLQSTPACMYPQEQVFGPPIRFESPATSLLSPYSEEYYGHNVPQPTVNPTLPEPGYFTKPCAVTSTQPSRSPESNVVDPKLSFGPQLTGEPAKVPNFGGVAAAQATTAFKFKSNFKSNDGDFTFSSAQGKNSESLLGLLTSDIPPKAEVPSEPKHQTQDQSEVFTFGSKAAAGFSFTDGAQNKISIFGDTDQSVSFTSGTKPTLENSEASGETDNDSTHVEEDEDGPHFEPIVPLPDKVDVKTGEEEEEEMFCKRAKLFRFDSETKEWKERGVGSIKILKHKSSRKVRLLMRREQVLKICANHYINTDMALKPNAGSDKSWVWYAMDYADEMPKTEQLAIRFKTAEDAVLFKVKFEEAQKFISESPQDQQTEKKSETPQPQVSSKAVDLKTLFSKKEGEWDCDMCCVRNAPTSAVCVACNSAAPSTAQIKAIEEPKDSGPVAPPAKQFSFGLSGDSAKNTSSTDVSSKGFTFGSQVPVSFKFGSKDASGFGAQAETGSQGSFQFGQNDPTFKGFAGAGKQLFTGFPSGPKADTSGDQDDEMYKTEEDDDIQFEPVVQMPEKVDLVTGEDDEKVLYSQRLKLFRFDTEANQWKERGVGNLKLLKNNQNGRLRILMRREQVFKVCANHWITTTMNLKPLSGSDRAWMWLASDFSDGDAKLEQLAAKFKTPELAEEFKLKFEECQRLLLDIPLQTPHKLVNTGRTAHLIQKAEEMKSGLKDLKSFLTCQNKDDEIADTSHNTSAVVVKLESESTAPTLEWDNYDLRKEVHEDYASSSVRDTPSKPDPVSKNLFCFGESSTGFSFSFQPILSPSKSPSKLNQSQASVGTDDEQEASQEEERDGQYFEPVVPLPDLVDVSTGEENEQVLFSHRAKLYRYDKDLSQWKERGIGDLKILQHYETKHVRLVMRRDQVLKLCANHRIASNMKLEPMKGSDKAWIWSAFDFAEGQGKMEQLAVRFKLQETANAFKDIFEEAKTVLETDTLLTPISARAPASIQETLCGKAAVAVLEETTKERTELSEESIPKLDPTPQSIKNLVSPPKFVFGSGSVQKIFGSPPPSKEKSPVMIPSSTDEETAVSRLKTSGPAVTSQSSVGTPFSIPTSKLYSVTHSYELNSLCIAHSFPTLP